jgi:hypothetical protein
MPGAHKSAHPKRWEDDMNKNTGIEFLKIAAFLYAMRYVVAALFMGPGLSSWNKHLFNSAYKYVGSDLTVWAAISALIGMFIIVISLKKKQ